MSATTQPAGCTWDQTPNFDPDGRTLRHMMDCEVCAETWPRTAREMRIARNRALPSDAPGYLGENVGYKDK